VFAVACISSATLANVDIFPNLDNFANLDIFANLAKSLTAVFLNLTPALLAEPGLGAPPRISTTGTF
jgi:hypothetical protein